MKVDKTGGLSGAVPQMLETSWVVCGKLVSKLANTMIRNSDIPSNLEDSFIFNIFQSKIYESCQCFMLLDYVIKGIGRVILVGMSEEFAIMEQWPSG